MSHLKRVWVAMRTHDSSYAGTNSQTVLIINEDGTDRLHHTFTDTPQYDQEKGQANLYDVGVAENYINLSNLNDSSVRVGIRGGDMWKPEHYFVWGERPYIVGYDQRGIDIVPIAIETHLSVKLSTERGEGPISFPLRRVQLGARDMQINRLLTVMTTADESDAGTDHDIEIKVIVPGTPTPKANYIISGGDYPQDDQDRAQANFYFVPVNSSFTYNDLDDNSIRLSIKGNDAWLPQRFFLFGLDTASGRPNAIVPLVHISDWRDGWLSTDSSEGESSVTLDLVWRS